ncbi:hypothetical protein AIOGIFDO_00654 [Candidatus Methanoperedenaceae archaeon GB37]|nr:hypothetical protein AIOGIFDO_00654 [Candidatus Methanoperedenaceae archaeon GB37]
MKPNPLMDVPENIYSSARESVSFLEKMGLVVVSLFGGFLVIFSAISFAVDIWNFNILNAVIDSFVFIIGSSIIFYSFKHVKRVLLMDSLLDMAFQEGLYARLEPVLSRIARSHVESGELREMMNRLDTKMKAILQSQYSRDIDLEKLFSKEEITVGTSLKFTIKAVFLLIVSLAIFLLLTIPGIPFPQYIFLFLFILWWLFLTSEYDLWENHFAWTFLFFPMLVVPVTFMLVSNLYSDIFSLVLALFYILTGFYVFLYYLWAVYETTGNLPLFFETALDRERENEFFNAQRPGFFHDIVSSLKAKASYRLSSPRKKRSKKE